MATKLVKKAKNSEVGISVSSSSVPAEKYASKADLVSSLNADLLMLMRLDEFEKAVALSRKYNYFNQYGNFILNYLNLGKREEIIPLIQDLLLGPLYLDFQEGRFQELCHLPHLLLAAETDALLRLGMPLSPLVVHLLSSHGQDLSFARFQERLSQIVQSEGFPAAIEALIAHYAVRAFGQLEERFHLTEEFLSSDLRNYVSLEEQLADRRSALAMPSREVQPKKDLADPVLAIALRNIQEYLGGQSQDHYFRSQLKLDALALLDFLPLQEMAFLVSATKLYDLMPIIALRLAQNGAHKDAAQLIAMLVNGSSLYTQNHDFALELLKRETAQLSAAIAVRLSQRELEHFFQHLSWVWPADLRTKVLRHDHSGQSSLDLPDELPVLSAKILEGTNKMIISHSTAPRPQLTLAEALNLLNETV